MRKNTIKADSGTHSTRSTWITLLFLKLKQLKQIFSNMLFRGDEGLAATLYFWTMLSASLTFLTFAVYNLAVGKKLMALVLFLVAVIISSSIVLLYRKIFSEIQIYQVSTAVFFLLFSFLVNGSDGNIERLFWCCIFPIATIFVIGVRWGTLWSILFILVTVIQFLFFWENGFSQSFLFSFVIVYTIIMMITGWVQFYKNKYYQKIKQQHAKLELEIESKRLLESKLTIMSRVDSLSNLLNQKYFWDLVEDKKLQAEKSQHSICMAIIDIDNFKSINDNHGHPKGDEVIKAIAKKIQQHIGDRHLIGRIGGDEFGILFIDKSLQHAYEMVNGLRQKIASLCFDLSNHRAVTVSIGLARLENDVKSAIQLYKKADLALYEAKNKGKNQVVAIPRNKKSLASLLSYCV